MFFYLHPTSVKRENQDGISSKVHQTFLVEKYGQTIGLCRVFVDTKICLIGIYNMVDYL